uniref:C2H2-type domain-containing protein n=1 Tax=Otus sunia TaxID=257818 RepID=A0A8C8BBJ1_9STRI
MTFQQSYDLCLRRHQLPIPNGESLVRSSPRIASCSAIKCRGGGLGVALGQILVRNWLGIHLPTEGSEGFITFPLLFPFPGSPPESGSSQQPNSNSIPTCPISISALEWGGDDTQGSYGPRSPQKSSFNWMHIEDPQENASQPQSSSRGKEEYMCDHCGRVFSSRNSLIFHQETHTRENLYKCQDCGKNCKDRWKLLRLHTHTGERPYTFSDCRKSFRQRCHLWRHHSVIHNGESSGGVLWHNPASGHERLLFALLHCEMTFQQSYHLYLWKHQLSIPNGESLVRSSPRIVSCSAIK